MTGKTLLDKPAVAPFFNRPLNASPCPSPHPRPDVLVGQHRQTARQTSRRYRHPADRVPLGLPRGVGLGHRSLKVQRLPLGIGEEPFQQVVSQELAWMVFGVFVATLSILPAKTLLRHRQKLQVFGILRSELASTTSNNKERMESLVWESIRRLALA